MKVKGTRETTTPASHPESNLGRFFNVEPQWQGSTYSYVRPTIQRKRNRTDDGTTNHNNSFEEPLATQQTTLDFPVCGSITIEQHSDRVSANGTTGTGFALWSSALAVSEYLDARFDEDAVPSWKDFVQNATTTTTTTRNTPTCLELGAGLGLPSIVLARHGFHVVATDHEPEVLSLLERNIRVNLQQDDSVGENATHVSVEALDWAHPGERQIASLTPDLIIASDVIWNGTRPVWRDFLSLLNRLRQNRKRRMDCPKPTSIIFSLPRYDQTPTPHSDPLVLLGYTQRRLDMTAEEESYFFTLLHQYGMQVHILPPNVAPYSDHWPLTVLMELRWVS